MINYMWKVYKNFKDFLKKSIFFHGQSLKEVNDLKRYFATYGPIKFKVEKYSDGIWMAYSQNFTMGSIVTTGTNNSQLSDNTTDAILTAFKIPTAYKKEAGIRHDFSESGLILCPR